MTYLSSATDPEVQTAAVYAKTVAREVERIVEQSMRELFEAARIGPLTASQFVSASSEFRRLVARGLSVPADIAAKALAGAFAQVIASSLVIRRAASIVEEVNATSLAPRLWSEANELLFTAVRIGEVVRTLRRAAEGRGGVGDVLDWAGTAGWALLLFSLPTGGVTFLPGVLLLAIDNVLDLSSRQARRASDLAAAACEARRRATGVPCTPEDWQSFYERERQAQREDAPQQLVGSMFSKILEPVGTALGWLLFFGGVGIALYYLWPVISPKLRGDGA
jgi:hypothetical protein